MLLSKIHINNTLMIHVSFSLTQRWAAVIDFCNAVQQRVKNFHWRLIQLWTNKGLWTLTDSWCTRGNPRSCRSVRSVFTLFIPLVNRQSNLGCKYYFYLICSCCSTTLSFFWPTLSDYQLSDSVISEVKYHLSLHLWVLIVFSNIDS